MIRFLFLLLLLCAVSCTKKEPAENSLRLNLAVDPVSLDPRKVKTIQDLTLVKQLSEGLMRLDAQGIPQPALAETVTISEDFLIYTFHLRKSLWDDLTPCTAEHFMRSWQEALSLAGGCDFAFLFFPILNAKAYYQNECSFHEVGIQQIDDFTLQVTLAAPTPYFLELVAFPTFFPVKEGCTNGPFSLKQWDVHRSLVLEKNPHYWDKEAVCLNQIIFSIIEDSHTESCLFEKDEIDWMGPPISKNINPESMQHWKEAGLLFSYPVAGTFWIQFNTESAPFHHPKMRQAFSAAIDRSELVAHLFQGDGKLASTLLPPTMQLNESLIESNISLALTLFEEALSENGWDRKTLPTITLSYPMSERIGKIVQLIQQQWQKTFDIPIKLASSEYQLYRQKAKAGAYQVGTGEWIADFNDPISFLELFTHQNEAKWQNSSYNLLLKNSLEAPQSRQTLLQEAEKILLKEFPITPVYHYSFDCVKKPYLKEVILSPLGLADFKTARLERL